MVPTDPSPPPASSSTTFPILAITTLGILTTVLLLLTYYIFVIKCCLDSHVASGGLLRRLLSSVYYSSRRTGRSHIPPVPHHTFPEEETRGLDPAAIRSIPVVEFAKGVGAERRPSFHECAVCLSEFEEGERVKLLPSCAHPFHIDCIDTWLQFNAKCPLCRSEVLATSWDDHVVVVISPRCGQVESRGAQAADEVSIPTPAAATSPARKFRSLQKAGSVGDECIDVRARKGEDDEQFRVQPVRRSISMDSSNDRQLYLSVQEILRQNQFQFQEIRVSGGEGCSTAGSAAGGGGRVRRPFFSFSWSSRSPVLPMKNDVR